MVRDDEDLFAGRYELVDVLGSGGSGVVRRAHDRVLDRSVAIKLLRANADDEALRARLRDEARLAGSLHHPGIAQVYDYGEVEVRGEPTPYLVMQYVEGTSVSQLLREHRALDVREVMDVLAQVADALRAAHAVGIVHRDLKPSNVLVTETGRAVLVDVGVAEPGAAEPPTGLSDIHSLGVLANQCLASIADVPPEAADLVAEMIADEPDDRPGAAEVAERARALSGRSATTSSRVVLPPLPTPPVASAARTPVWRRDAFRSRRVQMSAAAVVVALVGTVFVAARPAPTPVPDVEGMTWSDAKQVLKERELEVERRDVDVPDAERGTVLDQEPEEGATRDASTVVVLDVASGMSVLDPDEVVGQRYEVAARAVVRQGLVPVRNDVPRPGGDGTTVVTALPAGRLATGTAVTLTVGIPQP